MSGELPRAWSRRLRTRRSLASRAADPVPLSLGIFALALHLFVVSLFVPGEKADAAENPARSCGRLHLSPTLSKRSAEAFSLTCGQLLPALPHHRTRSADGSRISYCRPPSSPPPAAPPSSPLLPTTSRSAAPSSLPYCRPQTVSPPLPLLPCCPLPSPLSLPPCCERQQFAASAAFPLLPRRLPLPLLPCCRPPPPLSPPLPLLPCCPLPSPLSLLPCCEPQPLPPSLFSPAASRKLCRRPPSSPPLPAAPPWFRSPAASPQTVPPAAPPSSPPPTGRNLFSPAGCPSLFSPAADHNSCRRPFLSSLFSPAGRPKTVSPPLLLPRRPAADLKIGWSKFFGT